MVMHTALSTREPETTECYKFKASMVSKASTREPVLHSKNISLKINEN